MAENPVNTLFNDEGATCTMAPAVVVGLEDDPSQVEVRLTSTDRRAEPLRARLAIAGSYRPTEGDRVLVLSDPQDAYVVGVLHGARRTEMELPDGAKVRLINDGMELSDADGNLLVRYAEGTAQINAPRGDLTLAAPRGRLRIQSGLDVQIEAGRDLLHQAARKLSLNAGTAGEPQLQIRHGHTELDSERLDVRATKTTLITGRATVVANHIANTAKRLATNVERYELTAERLVERSKNAFRDVADLLQMRVGRARHLVKNTFALHSRRTVMVSKKETSIDGKKILLG